MNSIAKSLRAIGMVTVAGALVACGGGGGGSSGTGTSSASGNDTGSVAVATLPTLIPSSIASVNLVDISPTSVGMKVATGGTTNNLTLSAEVAGRLAELFGQNLFAQVFVVPTAGQESPWSTNASLSVALGLFHPILTLQGLPLTQPGLHTGTIRIYVCLDAQCQRQFADMPLDVPYAVGPTPPFVWASWSSGLSATDSQGTTDAFHNEQVSTPGIPAPTLSFPIGSAQVQGTLSSNQTGWADYGLGVTHDSAGRSADLSSYQKLRVILSATGSQEVQVALQSSLSAGSECKLRQSVKVSKVRTIYTLALSDFASPATCGANSLKLASELARLTRISFEVFDKPAMGSVTGTVTVQDVVFLPE
jgi:hypothetical protein